MPEQARARVLFVLQSVTTLLQDVDEVQTVTTTAADINERQLIQTDMTHRSEIQVYKTSGTAVRWRACVVGVRCVL